MCVKGVQGPTATYLSQVMLLSSKQTRMQIIMYLPSYRLTFLKLNLA